MKANKALKRLKKIEALMANVTERYRFEALHIRKALHQAKDATARVKAAVRSEATSATAKAFKPLAKSKRRLSTAGRKAIQDAARRHWAQTRGVTANRRAKKAAAKNAAVKTRLARRVK
jgi:hypothetical protein